MNFGIGVTCGFGQPGVDPTLGQLEVFANEDANGRVGSNLAQAAMLNFGNGLNAGYGNGADSGLRIARDEAHRIPALGQARRVRIVENIDDLGERHGMFGHIRLLGKARFSARCSPSMSTST